MAGRPGRPPKDLSPFQDEILELVNEGYTYMYIKSHLEYQHGVRVGLRTLERQCSRWGVQKKRKPVDSRELRDRISTLFKEGCFTDKKIMRTLNLEGVSIHKKTLQRIRRDMGLYQRISPFNQEETNARLTEVVQEELNRGYIEGFGRGYLQAYFRDKGHSVSRDRLFAIVRELDPEGIERRKSGMQRHRGSYIVPGPNYVWSIDGHCKLDHWGFQIYAAIDAYSRFVIWVYVGISSHTAKSVLRQYVNAVAQKKVVPHILRSDRGVETTMIAAAHYELRKCHDPEMTIGRCYRYGTSTANQRIEAWWNQLTRSLLFRWRGYFRRLSEDGLWDKDLAGDRIALLAVYMPIIRVEIQKFVKTWNSHPIRRQKNRPECIAGQPVDLYHWLPDGTQEYGLPVDEELLHHLQQISNPWDVNEYLPRETKEWCREQLGRLGYNPAQANAEDYFPTGARRHCRVYLAMREAVKHHIESGREPELRECERQVGNWMWNEQPDLDAIGEMDLQYVEEEMM